MDPSSASALNSILQAFLSSPQGMNSLQELVHSSSQSQKKESSKKNLESGKDIPSSNVDHKESVHSSSQSQKKECSKKNSESGKDIPLSNVDLSKSTNSLCVFKVHV